MTPVTPHDVVAPRLMAAHASAILHFWVQFAEAADALDRGFSSGDPGGSSAVMAALRDVHPDLMWEFGPSDRGQALCITAEWRYELRALARAVVVAAPDLPRWRFTDAREPLGALCSVANFEARGQQPLCVRAMQAVPGPANKVGIAVSGDGTDDGLINQALLLATMLLGEEADRDWLGPVTVGARPGPLRRLTGRLAPFDAAGFLDGFAAQVAAIRDGLPDPLAAQDPQTRAATLLTIGSLPEGAGRDDLATFSTASMPYAESALEGRAFASCNHSRHGEWFAFLRIPHEGMPGLGTDVMVRAEIEDSLHAVLSRAGIGGMVAAGHGHEAVYLDFGMSDLGRGLNLLASTFAARPWAGAATVHFLEAGLATQPLALTAPLRAMQ
ncbi:MAG: hypothetical protein ACT4OK_12650 [Gemmobacter sp.]